MISRPPVAKGIGTITIGSTSAHKFLAASEAAKRLGVEANIRGIRTDSGQNEQPVGFDETYMGALTRAKAARAENAKGIAVGIESGIFAVSSRYRKYMDIAVVVVLTEDGREIVTNSSGVEFSEEIVQMAARRNFKNTTVGSVIAETAEGGDATDPHSIVTHGRITRTMTLIAALEIAFRQVTTDEKTR